ncbi:disease resistance protein SUMM2-like [Magnolia sinica]|uniref:disease resistance protein SUMM2-like n=1 Tax=Magnolia sinica TaxID=86752 RepID=UPI002657C34C|nr:disease resistance protein SUMM2-like [Magnolia sinica]
MDGLDSLITSLDPTSGRYHQAPLHVRRRITWDGMNGQEWQWINMGSLRLTKEVNISHPENPKHPNLLCAHLEISRQHRFTETKLLLKALKERLQLEAAMEFFWETAKNATKNAWDQYNYSRSLQENLHVLKNEMRELSSREADIKNELNIAKILYGKKPKEEVNLWLENVEKIISEVTKIEEDSRQVRRYYLLSHLALGKLVIKKIEEVVKLKEKGQFSEGLLAYLLPESGSMPTAKLMGGMTAERNLERIWEFVTDHDVRTIGVYGMGGVGKTTIMTHVYNRIIKSSIIFGIAIWVTVSNNFNIERLQNDIARGIGLKFSNEEDEMRKSMKLFEALKRMEKFVIILDDVWRPFPLEKVGIPEGSAYKIILTTRSKHVCRGMKCHKKFEVEVLPKEEA